MISTRLRSCAASPLQSRWTSLTSLPSSRRKRRRSSEPAARPRLEAQVYLEGQQGAYIETRNGFDVDGVEIKCRLDFGAKAIDWRGLYKNPGA